MKRETREEARQLRQQGQSITTIATQLGVSKGSVSQWVRDIELTTKQQEKLKQNQRKWGAQNKGAQVNREVARQKRAKYQEEGRKSARHASQLHLMGGIRTLQVHSTKITHHIYGAIQEYGGFDNTDWLF